MLWETKIPVDRGKVVACGAKRTIPISNPIATVEISKSYQMIYNTYLHDDPCSPYQA
jgi:hypothetical protein